MSDEKMSDTERARVEEALKHALLTDSEITRMIEGGTPGTSPTSTEEDLVTAAASAMEFVEKLETPSKAVPSRPEGEAVAGFDALLRRLETLRSDIASLQRGVVGVFAAQLLTFRGKVVELKSKISEEMVQRLRMQFFKSFIESTFVDIVDNEFTILEKDLVDKIVEQTQERFKEFSSKVRESEDALRRAIVEQQDVVNAFIKSLEEDSLAIRDQLREKEAEIVNLRREIERLHAQIDMGMATGMSASELSRRVGELEARIDALKSELATREAMITQKDAEIAKAHAQIQELQIRAAETMSQVEVLKAEKTAAAIPARHTDAEYEVLQRKFELLQASLEEKRKEAEQNAALVKQLEERLKTAIVDRKTAEELATKRLKELESVQDRIREIKDLEERIYTLEQTVKSYEQKIALTEMQREAHEKAVMMMERERDRAFEEKRLAEERTARYIKALGVEASTRVLLIVDEVGSISFSDLGKSLGIAEGLAAKYARQLEKLGVIKIENDRAISTLREATEARPTDAQPA